MTFSFLTPARVASSLARPKGGAIALHFILCTWPQQTKEGKKNKKKLTRIKGRLEKKRFVRLEIKKEEN